MATKVITGKVRFSYVNAFEPRASVDGGDPKYSVTLLIPKTDTATLGAIKIAMQEARDKFAAKNGEASIPAKFKHTMHDGDGERESGDPFGPECKGCYVTTVSSKQKPVIVDAFRNPITDPAELYSGCYGRAAINFYGYNFAGKKGVSAGLLSLQKLCDGEAFGAVGSADDFNDGYSDGEADDDFML